MTNILGHVAEAFPPDRQGAILNFHRVIGIATNTSMALNCALGTLIMMTYPGLTSYSGQVRQQSKQTILLGYSLVYNTDQYTSSEVHINEQ